MWWTVAFVPSGTRRESQFPHLAHLTSDVREINLSSNSYMVCELEQFVHFLELRSPPWESHEIFLFLFIKHSTFYMTFFLVPNYKLLFFPSTGPTHSIVSTVS